MFRITLAHGLWLVSDWLEDAREKLLDAAGKVAGL
jgi:hypothetical protein